MAKELWHNSITKHTEWTGDESTNGLAVAGDAIQKFIKDSFDTKIGYLYPYTTSTSSKYWAFADEESCQLYLTYFENPGIEEYQDYAAFKLGEWDAPAPYTASITVITENNKATYGVDYATPMTLLSTQTNNYLYFNFAIKDSGGTETNENIKADITFTNNGATKTFSGTFQGGQIASVLLDEYLEVGNNVVNITITGNSSEASTKTSFTIVSVQLNLSSNFEFEQALEENAENLIIPYTLIGAGTKFVEWYIDGELVDDGKTNPIAQTTYGSNKFINVTNLAPGKHNVQFRSYVEINTVPFYGSLLYYDFFKKGVNEVAILLSAELESGDVVTEENPLKIDFYQYEKSSMELSSYDYQGRYVDIQISIDGKTYSTLRNSNGRKVEFTYTPEEDGVVDVKFSIDAKSNTGITDHAEASCLFDVEKSQLSIAEVKGGIKAKFSAKDRSNEDANKDVWTYTDGAGNVYSATFNNVAWNKYCGWSNDALILSNGATVTFNFNPFNFITSNGFTFEIEFETGDIKSDEVQIMKFGGKAYKSFIEILATSAQLNSDLSTNIKTNYRDGERMKLAFIINSKTNAEAHNLMWIINNGILERCAAYADNDTFQVDPNEKTFTIGNPDGDVTTKIYSIRIYESAITTLQEFDNFALDSGRIASLVSNNDVLEDGKTTVSIEKVRNKIPTMLFTGDMEKLRKYADKKSKVLFDVDYVNPKQPEYNFRIHNAYVTKQGTSSIKYPCPNIRLYIKKEDSITFQLTGIDDIMVGGKKVVDKNTVFEVNKMYYIDAAGNKRHPQTHQITNGKLTYAFKDGALPNQVWTLKADFAESSMTHNTGTARWWGSMLREVELANTNAVTGSKKVCKTKSQMAVENANAEYPSGYYDAIIQRQMYIYPFDINTAVDGFPICIFARQAAESTNVEDTRIKFMGLFNMNVDKSSTDSFGFKKIEVYKPSKVGDNGEVLELKKTKIWDTKKTFCWEGSANEEALGKYLNVEMSKGCVDAQGRPSYDFKKVDDRSFYAAFETRYPDADEIVLKDGTKVPADMFNNSTCFESLIRFVNFTKPALDLRVFLTDGVNYEDGYTLKSFTPATDEQVIAFRDNGTPTLYIKTSDDSLGVADTYEPIQQNVWYQYADFKKVVYKKEDADGTVHYYSDAAMTVEVPNENEATFYVDKNGNVLPDQTDITARVWQTQFYVKRTDIDFEHTERHVWTAEDGPEHVFDDYVYLGYIKSWHLIAMEQGLEGKIYIDEDNNEVEFHVKDFAKLDDPETGEAGDNNVEVYLTKIGPNQYTYVDDWGQVQNYNYVASAAPGQLGSVKALDYRGRTMMDFFSNELANHYDIYKLASYFIYVRRFGAVDQMVKNVMITTEDRVHWYYIHYDNDTILGVRNDSLIKYNWDLHRDTYDASVNNYAYAGHQSVLWNNLEMCETFMAIVKQLDAALAKLPVKDGKVNALTYDGACYWYDTVQADSWPEKLYNASEDYKYISPYIENTGNSPYLAFLQGNRKSHRHWWLRHRFDLIDAEWVSGEYADFYIGCYIPSTAGTQLFTFKPASDFYFGFMTNTDIRRSGVYVKGGQEYTFTCDSDLNVGDPVKILGPYQIEELDFSVSNGALGGNMLNLDGDGKAGIYVDTRGTKLKKLIVGNPEHDTLVEQISSLTKVHQLQWLDIRNCANLKQNPDISQLNNLHIFEAEGANISSFYPCEGTNLYRVVLPSQTTVYEQPTVRRYGKSSISNITLKDVTFDSNLNFDYKGQVTPGFFYEPDENLDTVNFVNVKGLDTMQFVQKWYNAILESGNNFNTYNLTLEGIDWRNADPEFLLNLKNAGFKTLVMKGYVLFRRMTYNQYTEITKEENYGPNVFNTSGELVFDAPATQYLFTDIAGQKSTVTVKSGTTVKFSTVVFPLSDDNVVTYHLMDNAFIGDDKLVHDENDTLGLNDYYKYGIFKLYTKTGVLEIEETTTTSTSIKVLIKVKGEIQETFITLYATGITIPRVFDLQGLNGISSTNITFESLNEASYKVVLDNQTYALRETDALVDDLRFEIYDGDNNLTPANYEYGRLINDYIICSSSSYDEMKKLSNSELNSTDSRDYFEIKDTLETYVDEDGETQIKPVYKLVEDKSTIDLTGETFYYALRNSEFVKVDTKDLSVSSKDYYFTAKTELADGETYYALVESKAGINSLSDKAYYIVNHVVIANIVRNTVPASTLNYRVRVKPVYRTSIEANKIGGGTANNKYKDINLTIVSVIPSKWRFDFKKTLNPDVKIGVSTMAAYNAGRTTQNITMGIGDDEIKQVNSEDINNFDIIAIIDGISSKNITGFRLLRTGTYHISFVGYTSNNIKSNVGLEDPRASFVGLSYNMKVQEITAEGFDLVLEDKYDAITGKPTTNVADTSISINNKFGSGIYCALTSALISNEITNDSLSLGINIIYPTKIEIDGDDIVGVSYQISRSITHNYSISSEYDNNGLVSTTAINIPYYVRTRFNIIADDSDANLISNVVFASDLENGVSSNPNGYTINLTGSTEVGQVKGKVTVQIFLEGDDMTPYLTQERELMFQFTFASATTGQELIDAYDETGDRKWYLMDENRSFYIITKEGENYVSNGWNFAKESGLHLVGLATVFERNEDNKVIKSPLCIAFEDMPAGDTGAKLGLSGMLNNLRMQNGKLVETDSNQALQVHLTNYGWYGWEKRSMYLTSGNIYTSGDNTLFNQVIRMYSEYPNIYYRTYVPDGAELKAFLIDNFEETNKIISTFVSEEAQLKDADEGNGNIYWSIYMSGSVSAWVELYSGSGNTSLPQLQMVNINNNRAFIRPFIRIAD